MRPCLFRCFLAVAVWCCLELPAMHAQAAKESTPADTGTAKISVDAKLVVVPVVVSDKKGLVTTLNRDDFYITVDNKPQTIRYFDHDTDVPLTVGLLVDVSRSQANVLDEEQKASQKFLDSFLQPAKGNRPADKAFVLQFGHSAELLQDVTDSRPLLAAGLKEIGTQAPGAGDDTQTADNTDKNTAGTGNSNPNNGSNNGGYGPYGRRGGYPNSNGGSRNQDDRARSGTVLYDSLYLASDEVMRKQTGRRALVVLTDGVDRHSRESLLDSIEAAQRADTVVYAIYYKGQEQHNWNDRSPYGGYPGYGRRYPGNYPGSGGRPGSDGTYADPDGKKILSRICDETGGRMFEVKGKGSVDSIYAQIGEELRAQYRLGFSPTEEAASSGYHPLQLSLTNPENKKLDLQTREGYYTGAARSK